MTTETMEALHDSLEETSKSFKEIAELLIQQQKDNFMSTYANLFDKPELLLVETLILTYWVDLDMVSKTPEQVKEMVEFILDSQNPAYYMACLQLAIMINPEINTEAKLIEKMSSQVLNLCVFIMLNKQEYTNYDDIVSSLMTKLLTVQKVQEEEIREDFREEKVQEEKVQEEKVQEEKVQEEKVQEEKVQEEEEEEEVQEKKVVDIEQFITTHVENIDNIPKDFLENSFAEIKGLSDERNHDNNHMIGVIYSIIYKYFAEHLRIEEEKTNYNDIQKVVANGNLFRNTVKIIKLLILASQYSDESIEVSDNNEEVEETIVKIFNKNMGTASAILIITHEIFEYYVTNKIPVEDIFSILSQICEELKEELKNMEEEELDDAHNIFAITNAFVGIYRITQYLQNKPKHYANFINNILVILAVRI